jgi:hypothetical protein
MAVMESVFGQLRGHAHNAVAPGDEESVAVEVGEPRACCVVALLAVCLDDEIPIPPHEADLSSGDPPISARPRQADVVDEREQSVFQRRARERRLRAAVQHRQVTVDAPHLT